MNSTKEGAPTKTGRNWWKIGFFVMLFLFEGAREWAVAVSAEPAKISTSLHVGRVDTFVSATGRWKRLDDGSKLIPGAVRIDCWEREARCYEAGYNVNNGYVGTPSIDVYDATFSDEAVTYENDVPDCARYRVRIDLKLKQVFASRDRKENPGNPSCRALEKRVQMTLGDGFEYEDPFEEHFLPLLWIVKKALGN